MSTNRTWEHYSAQSSHDFLKKPKKNKPDRLIKNRQTRDTHTAMDNFFSE